MPRSLPTLGFGTASLTDPENCVESVQRALDVGYRHIDTAQSYENEQYVGDGIEESEVSRDEVFLATKVGTENLAYEDVLASVEDSREKLGVETIDLLYVHWPTGEYDAERTLEAFDDLVQNGTIDRIGLSNFRVDQLEEADRILQAPIFAHQVECHPLLPQTELASFAEENDHHLVAYAPLARGEVSEAPEMGDIAGSYNATAPQVALAWLIKRGIYPIPMSSGDHIVENYRALELVDELTDSDMAKINGIEERTRLIDPEDAPWDNRPAAE